MKIRMGFVSNSSSSSFVIGKANLTPFQMEVLRDPREWASGLLRWTSEDDCIDHEWTINETDSEFIGSTIIDNFDMVELLQQVGVSESAISLSDDWCYGSVNEDLDERKSSALRTIEDVMSGDSLARRIFKVEEIDTNDDEQ